MPTKIDCLRQESVLRDEIFSELYILFFHAVDIRASLSSFVRVYIAISNRITDMY